MLHKSTTSFVLALASAFAMVFVLGCKNDSTNTNGGTNPDTTASVAPTPIDSNAIEFVADSAGGMKRFKTAGGKFGFYGKNDQILIPAQYSMAFDFKDGYAKVKKDGKFGYVDVTGKEVVPPTYEKISNYAEGKAAVLVNGKWGFINMNNEMILPAIYDSTQAFGEGLAPVMEEGATYWTYIDLKGKVVIGKDKKLEAAWPFSEGLAHGMKGNLWGYMDKKGREALPYKYINAGPFEDGSAAVQIETQWIRIDKKGKCVLNCEIQPQPVHQDGGQGHEGHDHSGHDHEGHDHEGHDH